MTDFFLRNADEQRVAQASYLDDIDLVQSKESGGAWGASLVAVAQRGGVHVCWRCGEPFDGEVKKLRPTEVKTGFALILLHAGCINEKVRSFRTFADITRGLQARRFFTNATKRLHDIVSKPHEDVSKPDRQG